MAEPFYIPMYEPFHVTEEGFRVWETSLEGKYICADLLQTVYRGDMKGVVRFIERRRREMGTHLVPFCSSQPGTSDSGMAGVGQSVEGIYFPFLGFGSSQDA